MGRPKAKIEPDVELLIEKFATIHASDDEIASILGIGETTLKRRFGPLLKKGRQQGRLNLRNWQMLSAEKGNVAMQIWLGKQILGQLETPPHHLDDDADVTYKTQWARGDIAKNDSD